MLTVAIANQKGGVGKTSVTLGLAGSLAAAGHRPLVIDLDPQANSTAAIDPAEPVWTTSDLLRPDPETGEVISGSLAQAIVIGSSTWSGVSLVAAELSLASREQEADGGTGGSRCGRRHVYPRLPGPSAGGTHVRPSGSLNAFTAADAVLLVTEPAGTAGQPVSRASGTAAQPASRLAEPP